MVSSVFCKKIKNFLENFQKTLQKCKSKYKRVGSFVKKCLKNCGVAVVTQRVGIPARRDRSFLLGAKWRGVSFQHLERNQDRALFNERKRKLIFLLSAKGRGFSFLDFERNKTRVCLQADKEIMFSFGRQKKQKRQGEFSEFPPAPQNSSCPHKRKARKRGAFAPPYLRGQMGNVNKRKKEMGTSARQKTRRR